MGCETGERPADHRRTRHLGERSDVGQPRRTISRLEKNVPFGWDSAFQPPFQELSGLLKRPGVGAQHECLSVFCFRHAYIFQPGLDLVKSKCSWTVSAYFLETRSGNSLSSFLIFGRSHPAMPRSFVLILLSLRLGLEVFQIRAVSLFLHLLQRDEAQRGGVYAIAQSSGRGAVAKHVSKM